MSALVILQEQGICNRSLVSLTELSINFAFLALIHLTMLYLACCLLLVNVNEY